MCDRPSRYTGSRKAMNCAFVSEFTGLFSEQSNSRGVIRRRLFVHELCIMGSVLFVHSGVQQVV